MKEVSKLTMYVNVREPNKGEEPNWLGWFNNKTNDYIFYAKNLDQMNKLLYPKTVDELEKDGSGVCRRIVYEKNGKRVNNVV